MNLTKLINISDRILYDLQRGNALEINTKRPSLLPKIWSRGQDGIVYSTGSIRILMVSNQLYAIIFYGISLNYCRFVSWFLSVAVTWVGFTIVGTHCSRALPPQRQRLFTRKSEFVKSNLEPQSVARCRVAAPVIIDTRAPVAVAGESRTPSLQACNHAPPRLSSSPLSPLLLNQFIIPAPLSWNTNLSLRSGIDGLTYWSPFCLARSAVCLCVYLSCPYVSTP